MSQELIAQLQQQNRLLKRIVALSGVGLAVLCTVAATPKESKVKFGEIDVERINIVNDDGSPAIVIANRQRLPPPVINGKPVKSGRGEAPGFLFYNATGDESGGFVFDGKLDDNGKPRAGMHFSMDRFGGDQQLALAHYENDGAMETGLTVMDRGLEKEYGPLFEAYNKAPEGPEKKALYAKWQEAGGAQTKRVFVGRTRGKSSAVILADAKGHPKIMMMVTPEGKPLLQFLDDAGKVIQTLPEAAK